MYYQITLRTVPLSTLEVQSRNIGSIQSNLINSNSWGLEVFFRIISSSNYRGIHKIYTPKIIIIRSFFYQNIRFGRVKETYQGDVPFTLTKHMLSKIYHE